MALLEVQTLDAFYGDFQALFGLSLTVDAGETLAIIGANGAGKSTLLKAITGLVPAKAEAIRFAGSPIGGRPAAEIMKLGIAMVPEGRKLFASLTVEENLLVGRWGRTGSGYWTLKRVYDLFPVLADRRTSPGTKLSGGQQQMVAIGRALMSNPVLLLCDEISLGLAPIIIRDIYAALPSIRGEGTAIVLVEQDIVQALTVSNRIVCLQEGRSALEGRPAELSREAIQTAYFGR